MGADLVGWMLKGPVKIAEGSDDLAISRAIKTTNLISLWLKDEGDMPDGLNHLYDGLNIEEAYEVEHLVRDTDSVVKFVKDFICFWDDPYEFGHRDVICRVFNNYRIIFAGDSTWGDEPSGGAYDTIKEAYQLGILEPLGIV